MGLSKACGTREKRRTMLTTHGVPGTHSAPLVAHGVGTLASPMLQMRQLRHEEVTRHDQDHAADECKQVMEPSSVRFRCCPSPGNV